MSTPSLSREPLLFTFNLAAAGAAVTLPETVYFFIKRVSLPRLTRVLYMPSIGHPHQCAVGYNCRSQTAATMPHKSHGFLPAAKRFTVWGLASAMRILLAKLLATTADERTDRPRGRGQSAQRKECAGQDFEHDGAVKAGINESPKEPSPWDVTADQ